MFKFNFGEKSLEAPIEPTHALPSMLDAQFCSLDNLKARAPRISYTKDSMGIPKRDLFDVKFELISSNDINEQEKLLLSGSEDIRKSVYEGGLKVWEGANDLIEVLTTYKNTHNWTNIMELGCGAGVPLCFLLYHTILSGKSGKFVFADYNAAVLSLLTMPNVALTWLAAIEDPLVHEDHGELILTTELIDKMTNDLKSRRIELQFVSGAWSTQFSDLVGESYDLVLASETIYSLDSMSAFTDVVQRAIQPSNKSLAFPGGIALIAAKKVYFGVGGGIVEFEYLLDQRKLLNKTILEKGSVGRVVLEVAQPDIQ